jgi:3-oxocholest-4-en-26-oyl-CoA dehydrogenase beta subunit
VDFRQTQAQQELSALSRRILGDRATPDRLAELERAGLGFDAALWAELARAGILAAAVPERAGGDGYGLAEQCSILIEVGRAVGPVPYLESIVLGAGVIGTFGSTRQIEKYVVPALAGELVITAALAEPGTSHQDELATEAERTDDGWRLTGVKSVVPTGTAAGLYLVTATTGAADVVLAVTPDDEGVTVEPQQVVAGTGAVRLRFADVDLKADRVIGPPDGEAAGWLLERATVGLCALQLGVTERALELTAEYARTRQQFGRPIGAFQAVAQRLADAYIDVEAIRLTMWQAAWQLQYGRAADEDLPTDAEIASVSAAIATAKFWAADGGHRVAHTTVHVHGGVGIDVSHPVHRYFAAAKRNEFALGGATAQLRRLGLLLAQP